MKSLLFSLLFSPLTLFGQMDLFQIKETTQKNYNPPTLWKHADGMEGFDSYCVYKSNIDKNLYLIGFDENGDENLKLLIQQVTHNIKLDECTIIYNGTEVRLRKRLQ